MSWVYGGIVNIRNWMFDQNILPVEEFDVPVIGVGNLTVGGTGKTPHVEYLVAHLAAGRNVAVLSRGYKRKTKGFVLANCNSTPDHVGDEPLQIYKKLGTRTKVAVCESRRKGIRELIRQFPDLELIILDDAYQHRYVKPKVNILLMDYNRPVYKDELLPLGRLREPARQTRRADMVIVTKCPANLPPLSFRLVSNNLELFAYQKLYFTSYRYGDLQPVFPNDNPYNVDLCALSSRDSALLVSGIANPRGFVRHFKSYPFRKVISHYPDHHDFTKEDLAAMKKSFKTLKGERKIIITTEKDAVRLAYNPYFPVDLKPSVFYIPVSVRQEPGLEESNIVADLISLLRK